MKNLKEVCKFCSYSYKDDEVSTVCPVCCGTRDTYDNHASQLGVTRNEVKAASVAGMYGLTSKSIPKEEAQKIFNKHSKFPIFGSDNES